MSLEHDLDEVWTELRAMLLEKNRAYGDSVFAPLGIIEQVTQCILVDTVHHRH